MKQTIKILCLLLSLTILTNTFIINAEENTEPTENITENILVDILDDLIVEDDAEQTGTISPRWGKGDHETSFTGSEFTNNQKRMLLAFSTLPDRTQLTFNALQYEEKNENGEITSEGLFIDNLDINGADNNNNYKNYFADNTDLYLSNGTHFSSACDINFREHALLHGGGNYVASLRYLYTVASNLWNGNYYKTSGITKRKIIRDAFEDAIINSSDLAQNSKTFYGDNTVYGKVHVVKEFYAAKEFKITKVNHTEKFTAQEQLLSLQKMIYLAANCYSDTIKLTFSNENYEHYNFQKEAGLKVLGIAIHLLGDIYAHKTVVPTLQEDGSCAIAFHESKYVGSPKVGSNIGNNIYRGGANEDFNGKGYWKGRQGIYYSIMGTEAGKRGGILITTHQLYDVWQKAGDSVMSYEDNIDFIPLRFEYAKIAIQKFINLFKNNQIFKSNIFQIQEYNGTTITSSNYVRLADLRLMAKKAGVLVNNDDPNFNENIYLRYYDCKVIMSDVVNLNANNNEIELLGPQTMTDSNWYGRGFKKSY